MERGTAQLPKPEERRRVVAKATLRRRDAAWTTEPSFALWTTAHAAVPTGGMGPSSSLDRLDVADGYVFGDPPRIWPHGTSGRWEEHSRAIAWHGSDWRRLRLDFPDHSLITAGDYNQNRDGRSGYTNEKIRDELSEALNGAGLQLVTDQDDDPEARWVVIATEQQLDPLSVADPLRNAAARVQMPGLAPFIVFGTVLPWLGSSWRGIPSKNGQAFAAALETQLSDWLALRSIRGANCAITSAGW